MIRSYLFREWLIGYRLIQCHVSHETFWKLIAPASVTFSWICDWNQSSLPPARGQRSFLFLYLLLCQGKCGSWVSGLPSQVAMPLFAEAGQLWNLTTLALAPPFSNVFYHSLEDARKHTPTQCAVMLTSKATADKKHLTGCIWSVTWSQVYWKAFPFLWRHKPHPNNFFFNSVSACSTWCFHHKALHGQWT